MSADRELLEMAAKAAGIQLPHFIEYAGGEYARHWDPLTDDGDALRLAIQLSMCIDIKPIKSVHSDSVFVGFGGYSRGGHRTGIVGLNLADRYESTRRAIVRAAAEIGKAIP